MNPTFSSKEKVAILLLNLGPEIAADILGNFGENEIAEISDIIGRMRSVSSDISVGILNEFKDEFQSWRKSEEIIDVIKDHRPSIIPFRYFKHLTSEEIISILSGEHTQLIALILSYLEPHQSAEVVGTMSEELRLDVLNKMATSKPPPVQIIKQIDEVLPKNGLLIQFTYDLSGRKKLLLPNFKHISYKIVWSNIPPARVDVYQKKGE